MKYAISDIHGNYEKYQEMLGRLDLKPDDTLYVLGDVIDRGNDGFKILLDMAGNANVEMLLGNHEAMAMDALPVILRTLLEKDTEALTEKEKNVTELWFRNGGEISLAEFLMLDGVQQEAVWEYMKALPLYREVEAGERKFLLLHGGLQGFRLEKSMDAYSPEDIVWCRPEPDTEYFPDKRVILGHTPTRFLYEKTGEDVSEEKFFHAGTYTAIDCGCAFQGGRLGCLCLDTMEEIYV